MGLSLAHTVSAVRKKTNLKRPRRELNRSLSARHRMREISIVLCVSEPSSRKMGVEKEGFCVWGWHAWFVCQFTWMGDLISPMKKAVRQH